MANDTMTQEDRLSRDAQGELNDGLTDEQGNNVGVGISSSGNDFGATPETINKISGGAGMGRTDESYPDSGSPITDGGRPDEDYQDDDISSGGNAAGSNGMVMGVGSAAGGTGLGTGGYRSSAVMDDKEFDAAMRANGDTVTGATAPDYDDSDDTGSGNSGMGSSMNSGAGGPNYAQGMGGRVSGSPDSVSTRGVKADGTIDMGNGNSGTGAVGAGNAGMNSNGSMESAMGTGSDDLIGDNDDEDRPLTTGATSVSRSDLGSNGG